ncbi:hypothetical protein ACK9YZ_16925 [Rhizobium sp. ZK1]|uniref:hypothetical protein n=1 Tax=Rhizobium sp. ZK1 TaxID=3389872 RepID=UPI0039F6B086
MMSSSPSVSLYESLLAEFCYSKRAFPSASARSDPTKLIAAFASIGVAARGYLHPEELLQIALLKNGGKLSGKTRAAIGANSAEAIEALTRLALSATDDELAIRYLLGLDGVNLATASCILAWAEPRRWPVIDVNAWAAIEHFDNERSRPERRSKALKVSDWLFYVRLVRMVAEASGRTPQEVDVWLYSVGRSLKAHPVGVTE